MKDELDSILENPIGIFGNGLSGRAAQCFIESLGGEAVIYDEGSFENPDHLFTSEKALAHDFIINSPGFPPFHPWFKIAQHAKCKVIGEVEFASRFWKGRTIFVTGTNGKSTITHLLTATFLKAGYESYAFGNIGIPFSDHHKFNAGDDAIAVVELSSFQAWNLKFAKVDGLIWSNFAEDHLDWHGEISHYFESKWNALTQVGDQPIVLGAGVESCALEYAKTLPAHVDVINDQPASVAMGGNISSINKLNIEYVKAFVSHHGIEGKIVDEVVQNFAFLPHRLEYVATIQSVNYWNDSKATNFHAVEAALDSFYAPVVWIGGGQTKGGDVTTFARSISGKIKKAIVFGSVAEVLTEALIAEGVLTFSVEDLKSAVEILKFETSPADDVLLSPGFSSYDQFTCYADRGRQFCDLIRKYLNTHTEINQVHINN